MYRCGVEIKANKGWTLLNLFSEFNKNEKRPKIYFLIFLEIKKIIHKK